MYRLISTKEMNLKEKYDYIRSLISKQISEEKDPVANMANISAIIMNCLEDLNWVGFYLIKDEELVLGPFQGLPACNRIKIGEGVCGYSVKNKISVLVKNVEDFPGHIACDSKSKSELVIPIICDGRILGVLDLDSPYIERFSESDKIELEEIIEKISSYIKIN